MDTIGLDLHKRESQLCINEVKSWVVPCAVASPILAVLVPLRVPPTKQRTASLDRRLYVRLCRRTSQGEWR
jgi:hypothetical protein